VDPRIPDKQNFRIGEAAKIAGVETYVLRFWESEFSKLKPSKSASNRRLYSQKDLALVLHIRDLLYDEGYTIAGARKQLKKRGSFAKGRDRSRSLIMRLQKEVDELLQLCRE